MHDHQRITCGPVTELLQKLVEHIAIVLHERLCFGGDQVLDQPRSLKETDIFIGIGIMVKSAYEISGSHNMLE